MQSRSRQILDKSIAAVLAAIEIYNKPDFRYREETFTILAVNAWELLLKARILQLSNNRLSAIIVYERRRRTDGTLTDKLYRKKGRSGTHLSIGLFRAYDRLINEYADTIPPLVRTNLEAICEVRDNAVHFLNKDFHLRKKVHELATANLKNYLYFVRQWFGNDLSQYQLFLMPIAFLRDLSTAQAVTLNSEERNLLAWMQDLEKETDDDVENNVNLTLDIDIRLKRTSVSGVTEVKITNAPDAIEVQLSEENIRDQFPWDYQILSKRMGSRYSDFLLNQKYHGLRKKLQDNPKICLTRYLDPGNKKSSQKKFYNPNIMNEFDKHYSRR